MSINSSGKYTGFRLRIEVRAERSNGGSHEEVRNVFQIV